MPAKEGSFGGLAVVVGKKEKGVMERRSKKGRRVQKQLRPWFLLKLFFVCLQF